MKHQGYEAPRSLGTSGWRTSLYTVSWLGSDSMSEIHDKQNWRGLCESSNSWAGFAGDSVFPERSLGNYYRRVTYRLFIAIKHILFGEEPHAVHQSYLRITSLGEKKGQRSTTERIRVGVSKVGQQGCIP